MDIAGLTMRMVLIIHGTRREKVDEGAIRILAWTGSAKYGI